MKQDQIVDEAAGRILKEAKQNATVDLKQDVIGRDVVFVQVARVAITLRHDHTLLR